MLSHPTLSAALVIVIYALVLPNAQQDSTGTLSPETGVVLHGAAARHMLDQCRGDAPDTTSALWEPSAIQVKGLEAMLGPLLQAGLDSAKRDWIKVEGVSDAGARKWPRPIQYYRQYVGVTLGGRQFIYVNGFDGAWWLATWRREISVTHHDSTFPPEQTAFDWSHRPVIVCDGGLYFFGVLYNPADSSFHGFEFNGF